MDQERMAASDAFYESLDAEERKLLEMHIGGSFMGLQGGMVEGSDTDHVSPWAADRGLEGGWRGLDAVVRRAPAHTRRRYV